MKFALALAFALLAGAPAAAALTQADLDSVEFVPLPNARVSLNALYRDANGRETTLGDAMAKRPALLLPVDYACRTTCGPALSIVSSALARSGVSPNEYRLLLVGLDPQSTAGEARAFAEARIADPKLLAATSVLTGSPDAIRGLTDAIGYKYRPDDTNKAFAHPTGLVALTADGRVARALSSLGVESNDLRLALTEASEGRIGGMFGRLSLLCYGFDPVHGIYTSVIERLLLVAALVTVILLAGAVAAMSFLTNRRGARS
jgi:protein SCO1/2